VGLLDRLRRMRAGSALTVGPASRAPRNRTTRETEAGSDEELLRARLHVDPNDQEAFARLAEIVRRHAAEGHEDEARPRAAADAEWALAEELAHSSRAWYPLIQLGRISLHDDPEGAQRRLSTAVEREVSGRALAESLAMLRREGKPELALSLGVGHWRPGEHVAAAGREMVHAAVEAGRIGEARRHLDALAAHSEADVIDLRTQLDTLAHRKR
jgi:hypothetical protein